MRINIKPLSVNKAWKGRRFKTTDYKLYEMQAMVSLRNMDIPAGNLFVTITFGFSNKLCDLDNPVKMFLDILQKRYDFNDHRISKMVLFKEVVKKGNEYIEFSIEGIDN